ncbi:MAG TPA: amino acid ABC transporter permease [Mycobacteriales bacterium]|nr:amino acid ABC transporter permease [Mycobacteriales bacterium]
MSASTRSEHPEVIQAVPVRHPGRWIAAAVIAVLVAMFVNSLVTNLRYGWDVVAEYLFADPVLAGLRRTLMLTALSMLIGVVGGVVLAVMRLSPNPLVSTSSWVYIWFFRGTPLIAQLLFWNFLGALYPRLGLGIPFGPTVVSESTNVLVPTVVAALLGLGLNEAAYMAEIVRGGIVSVDQGQTEAAEALGMTRLQTMRRIVLPQAMRVIVPPMGNETISMLKTSSLVVVIGYAELLTSVQFIYSRTFQTIPLIIVALLWYLFLTSVLSVVQHYVERHYARGSARSAPARRRRRVRLLEGRTRKSEGGV